MSKYYSKLIQINENLDKELMEKGIVNSEINANDTIVKNNKTDMVKEGDENGEDMVPVPADSLTDDQKQDILADTVKDAGLKVDQKVLDDISKNPEQLAGVQKILGDGQKNESNEYDSDGVVIRMDDDDLDLHGYVVDFDDEEDFWGNQDIQLTDNEQEALELNSEGEARDFISEICVKFKYDPSTFSIQNANSQVDDNGENWVSLDSMHPGATTLP